MAEGESPETVAPIEPGSVSANTAEVIKQVNEQGTANLSPEEQNRLKRVSENKARIKKLQENS